MIGTVGDGITAPASYDLTFSRLSIDGVSGLGVLASWIALVGPWNADCPPGQPYVHAYGTEGHSYGLLQRDTGVPDTIGNVTLRDLRLVAGGYGQALGVGVTTDLLVERVHAI